MILMKKNMINLINMINLTKTKIVSEILFLIFMDLIAYGMFYLYIIKSIIFMHSKLTIDRNKSLIMHHNIYYQAVIVITIIIIKTLF